MTQSVGPIRASLDLAVTSPHAIPPSSFRASGETGRSVSERLFRAVGLAACAAVAAPPLTQFAALGVDGTLSAFAISQVADDKRTVAFAIIVGLHIVGAGLFAAAFWLSTRSDDWARITAWRPRALLALQTVLGLSLATDFLFVVAAQIPFVCRPRGAAAWMTVQGVLTAVGAYIAWQSGTFVPLEGISAAPPGVGAFVTIATSLAWQLFSFGAGSLAVSERRQHRELALVNAEQRATAHLLADSSRMAERLHIARELHDSIGHHLAALGMSLEFAAHVSDGRAATEVRRAQDVARRLFGDVRAVVSAIRDQRPLDLRAALSTLTEGAGGTVTELSFGDDVEVHDHQRALALFRCAQEALTNALRHAGARQIWIRVRRVDGGVELLVRDDGRGAPRLTPGNGLTGMRERVHQAGGTLEISTAPGKGVGVRICLPNDREVLP